MAVWGGGGWRCVAVCGGVRCCQALRSDVYPPPICKNNIKIPKLDGNNTNCCSDKGVVLGRG